MVYETLTLLCIMVNYDVCNWYYSERPSLLLWAAVICNWTFFAERLSVLLSTADI